MTNVEFYILSTNALEKAWEQACSLIEERFLEHGPVRVELCDSSQVQAFDEMLWTFKASSFVPHSTLDSDIPAPVRIGTPESKTLPSQTWINLTHRELQPDEHYQIILEIIPDQQDLKEAARNRFRQYRQLGFECVTHHLR